MKRRSRGADSLELLLDTLCNTFGGVLFIAMLVVLLLQQTDGQLDRQRTAAALPDVNRLEADLHLLRAEIDGLRQTAQSQARVAGSALVRDVSRREQEATELRDRLAGLGRDRDRTLLEVTQTESELARTALAESDLREAIRSLRERQVELEQELEQERRRRSRTIGSPRVHSTGKVPVACELRYGRFYIVHRYRDGEWDGPDLEEYVVIGSESGALVIQANPAAGVPAEPPDSLRARLAGRLSPHPARQHYLDLIVRTDSFEQFHVFREALSGLGYELSILMAAPGDSIVDRGGTGRGVQ